MYNSDFGRKSFYMLKVKNFFWGKIEIFFWGNFPSYYGVATPSFSSLSFLSSSSDNSLMNTYSFFSYYFSDSSVLLNLVL